MAISDINKAMAMYAQPTEFDQSAWKTAFDIANSFTNAENNRTTANENARKHQELLDTQAWRTAYTNNQYETGIGKNKIELADLQRTYNNALKTDPSSIQALIAQNNYVTTSSNLARDGLLGQDELTKAVQNYGLNPDGTYRTYSQMYQAMQADGKSLSPYAFMPIHQAAGQDQANQQALKQQLIQSSMGSQLMPDGTRVSTGVVEPTMLNANINHMIATGAMTKEQGDALRTSLFPATSTSSTTQMIPAAPMSFTDQLTQATEAAKARNPVVPYQIGAQPMVVTPAIAATPQGVAFTTPQEHQIYAKKWAEELGLSESDAMQQLSGMYNMLNQGYITPDQALSAFNARLQAAKERKAIMDRAAAIPIQDRLNQALIEKGYNPADLIK